MIAGFLDTQFLMYLHVIPCNSIAIGRINRRKSTCEKEFNADCTSITTVPVTTRFSRTVTGTVYPLILFHTTPLL